MKFVLKCEGQVWQGWQSFTVRQTMESATHSFAFTTTDRLQEGLDRWNVKGGSRIDFYIDDALVLSGYVRKYSASISETAHAISIDGESTAIDLVEASHLGPYYWPAGPAQKVIDDVLAPFGLTLRPGKALTAIPKEGYRVGINDTPFEIIKKLLERDQLTVYTDRGGTLIASDGKDATDGGTLRRGDYVEISADHDLTNSYSQIIVKSQKTDLEPDTKAAFDAAQKVEKTVANPSMARYRPAVFVNSGEPEAQQELADDIQRRFAGDVITASVKLKTPYNKSGKLWGVNQLVYLDEPLIDARQKLVVSECEFALDESSGFTCNLSLKLPVAFDINAATSREVRLAQPGPFKLVNGQFAKKGPV